jgi:hypothetical protein
MNDKFEESGARRELEDVSARCLMFRVAQIRVTCHDPI